MRSQDAKYGSVADLFAAGIIRIAAKPPGNPHDIGGASFLTVPLIAGDYPALTPKMWNAAYREFSLPEVNVMAVANPAQAGIILDVFRRDPRYRGGGFGIGFKEVVLPRLDEVIPPADAVGAANIAKKLPDGRLAGWNTDGLGYAISLEERFGRRGETLKGKRVLIIGGGGTAGPIAFALAERGARPHIVNRTVFKADAIARIINTRFGLVAVSSGLDGIGAFIEQVDAVVSTVDDKEHRLDEYSTLAPLPLLTTPETIRENHARAEEILRRVKRSLVVSDVRLRRRELAMLRQARELGFETLDGGPMVVNQGYEAFWWLYGDMLGRSGIRKEDVALVMRQAADAA